MAEAKLYGQKSSGVKINGIIEDYYAYAGENISAGDFVEFIKTLTPGGTEYETTTGTRVSEIHQSYYGTVSAVELPNGNVFVAYYGNSRYMYGTVCTVSGAVITAGPQTALLSVEYSGDYAVEMVVLPNGNVFMAYSCYSSHRLNAMVVAISGTTITPGTNISLNSSSYFGAKISLQLLSSSNIFISHTGGSSYRVYGMVVTVSGTSITAGTDVQLSSSGTGEDNIATALLSSSKVFVAYSNSGVCGMVVSISGTTVTAGTEKVLCSGDYAGRWVTSVLLSSSKVFVAHSNPASNALYQLSGMIASISGTTITAGTSVVLSTVSYASYRTAPLLISSTKILIVHTYDQDYYLYGMVVTISGTTVTGGTDTVLNGAKKSCMAVEGLILSSGNIFVAHQIDTDTADYVINAQIFSVVNDIPVNQAKGYSTRVRKITKAQFDGVAKTGGAGGNIVKIYTL